jgi:hypothetical protein
MKCYHEGCNRKVEFELTGRWECNYHLGLDFEGKDMHPIRPLNEDMKAVPKGVNLRAIENSLPFYDSICPNDPRDSYRAMYNHIVELIEEVKYLTKRR